MTPARIEIRTCKETSGITRQRPDGRAERCMKSVHKSPSRHICQHAGAPLYPVGSPKRLSRGSPARLAGPGEDCHLQGFGGGSA